MGGTLDTTAAVPSAFDDIDRDLVGGAPYLLSHFDYLNSSNRPEADRVRALVDAFLGRYPEVNRAWLRNRLRSVDDIGHLGAFFELALHHLLIRVGCGAVEVEPPIQGTRRVPDFLVETPSGDQFYLEATLATGRSQANAAAQQRLDQAFKTIDSIASPDFFLSLSTSGMPTGMITGKRLKRELKRWLASLDYDEVSAAWQGDSKAVPVFLYEEHAVRFRIPPLPRRRSRGSTAPIRSIGGRMLDPIRVQPQVPIRNAIIGKATRYGDLDLPYIVAVNAMSDYANEEDAIDALVGSLSMSVRWSEAGYEDELTRVPDGVWLDGGGPINTRVSAVLSTERLTPWSLGQRRARLVVNPWAQKPLPGLDLGIDVLRLQEDDLRRFPGKDFRALFGLPEGWPESQVGWSAA